MPRRDPDGRVRSFQALPPTALVAEGLRRKGSTFSAECLRASPRTSYHLICYKSPHESIMRAVPTAFRCAASLFMLSPCFIR